MTEHKERINYIRDGEYFVGYPVNMRMVTVQAKSLDELKEKGKEICKFALEHMSDIINQDDPFELHEEKDGDVWLYGQQDAKIRKELQRYKDTFGDI